MQSPLRSASPDGPGATFTWIVAAIVAVALLLSQTIFIVPAGNVAVVTTLGKVTGTWAKNATASVQQYNGAGAIVTGSSFVAINRAQTVTGPTGGFWVGCDSIDGTWHLAWTECV